MFFGRSNHNEKPKESTEPGRKVRLTFRWRFDEHGNKYLEKDEEINRDAEIQSYLEETKIENIIQRASFDPSIVLGGTLTEAQAVDYTDMPTTLAEAQNLMIDVKNAWSKLPREIKQKFDNDVDKFIHGYGSMEWASALGLMDEGKPVEEEKEVKAVET